MPMPVPVSSGTLKGKGTPEPLSSNSSVPSTRPSPPRSTLKPPSRVVDEDYDEPGVADALMGLAGYRAPDAPPAPAQSPTVSSGRGRLPSPRPAEHRDSVSSSASRSRHSPPSRSNSLKRPLSPAPEDVPENKRTRVENIRRQSPGTPVPSVRQSPVPFRLQPASRSPEVRQSINEPAPYPQSPPLPAKLPPHPKPIGAGHASISNGNVHQLPPIATLASPASTTPSHPSPAAALDDRMQVDNGPRSVSPSSRPKPVDTLPPLRASHSRSNSGTRGTASPTSSRHSQEKMEVSAA